MLLEVIKCLAGCHPLQPFFLYWGFVTSQAKVLLNHSCFYKIDGNVCYATSFANFFVLFQIDYLLSY